MCCRYLQGRIVEERGILKKLLHERNKSVHETRQVFLRAENAIAMAEEVDHESSMQCVENCVEDKTAVVPDFVKSNDLHVPEFLTSITKVQHYQKNGRDYVRCPRYPNEIVMIAVDLMVHSDLATTRVSSALSAAWRPWMKQTHVQKYMQDKVIRPPGRVACNNYRQMIPWMVCAQVGMLLTKAYWRCKKDKQVTV